MYNALSSFCHCFLNWWPIRHSKDLRGHSFAQRPCVGTPIWGWKENERGAFHIGTRARRWDTEECKLDWLTSWEECICCPICQKVKYHKTNWTAGHLAIFDLLTSKQHAPQHRALWSPLHGFALDTQKKHTISGEASVSSIGWGLSVVIIKRSLVRGPGCTPYSQGWGVFLGCMHAGWGVSSLCTPFS